MISFVLSTVPDSGPSPSSLTVCLDLTLTLVHFAWQGTVVAAAFLVSNALLAKASANARYLAGVVALAAIALCPLVTYSLLPPTANSPHYEIDSTIGIVTVENATSRDHATLYQASLQTLPSGNAPSLRDPSIGLIATSEPSWLSAISPPVAAVYCAGVFAMLIRLALAFWAGVRLRSVAMPISDEPIRQMVGRLCKRWSTRVVPVVAYCHRVSVPVIVGVIRPMILLPPALMSGLNCQQLEALLAHEIAHIRRWDLAVNLAQRIIESFLFLHPAVWYISHRISVERENACDDLVLATGWHSTDYAAALLGMAELCSGNKTEAIFSAAALSASGDSPSQLKQRVLRMLGQSSASSTRLIHFGVLIPVLILISSISILMTSSIQRETLLALGSEQLDSIPSRSDTGGNDLAAREADQFSSNYKVLYFRQEQNPPCQQMDLVIKQISGIPIEVIDVDENRDVSVLYNITSVPCIVIVHCGEELARKSGFQTEVELTELFKAIQTLSRFSSTSGINLDQSNPDNLMVICYAVADLLYTFPSGLPDDQKEYSNPPKVTMANWLSVIDTITTTVEPKSWKMNGGNCTIATYEKNYSLVIRAPKRIHEQVMGLLAQIRRKMDVQICAEISWIRNVDEDFLKRNGFAFNFDSAMYAAHLQPEEVKRFKNQMHDQIVYTPKVTMFNNQVGQIIYQPDDQTSDGAEFRLFFRTTVMTDPKRVRFNLAINPTNLVNELIGSAEFIEDEGYVLFDVNKLLKRKNPDLILPYQSFVLIRPRIIVMQEDQVDDLKR